MLAHHTHLSIRSCSSRVSSYISMPRHLLVRTGVQAVACVRGCRHHATKVNNAMRAYCQSPTRGDDATCQAVPDKAVATMYGEYEFSSNLWPYRRRLLLQIAQFGLPALSIPLADPLMGLVDTLCIAQYSSTLALASLAPCTLVFNFITYIFNSLSITTTSLVAENLSTNNTDGARAAVSSAVCIAVCCGCVLTMMLTVFGRALIAATGCGAELIPTAMSYLEVRAWACPAVLSSMVLQASLLAGKDSFTPFLVVLVSGVINVVGDLVLITQFNMGVVGAAVATVVGQYAGLVILCQAATTRSKAPPYFRIPALRDVMSMGTTLGPLGMMYACKNMCYMLIQGTATRLSTVALAAHQPMWTLWNLCGFCNGPIEQAAMAFMPGARGPRLQRATAGVLVGCGMLVGVVVSCIASGLPMLMPGVFTPDTALWPLMRNVAPQGALALLCAGLDVASSGILMSKREYGFLARAMLYSLLLLTAFLTVCARSGLVGLPYVWWALVVFFGARVVQSVRKLWVVQFRGGEEERQGWDGAVAVQGK